MKKILILGAALLLAGCGGPKGTWVDAEREIIFSQGPVMRVLTIADINDSLVLRTPSRPLKPEDVTSEVYTTLAEKMLATVTSPEQDGVGIAAPQVGILRDVVAVKRYDKPGEPFEVYPNIRITGARGVALPGPEGCLSVPNRRGEVLRFKDIDITYLSTKTLRDTTERIEGYTAVIFQHECDHLDGTLYIDKLFAE